MLFSPVVQLQLKDPDLDLLPQVLYSIFTLNIFSVIFITSLFFTWDGWFHHKRLQLFYQSCSVDAGIFNPYFSRRNPTYDYIPFFWKLPLSIIKKAVGLVKISACYQIAQQINKEDKRFPYVWLDALLTVKTNVHASLSKQSKI